MIEMYNILGSEYKVLKKGITKSGLHFIACEHSDDNIIIAIDDKVEIEYLSTVISGIIGKFHSMPSKKNYIIIDNCDCDKTYKEISGV